MRCVGCGRELREGDEGVTWRRCSICKSPVSCDGIRYEGTRDRGLFKSFVKVMPVCTSCLPKSMLKRLAEKKLREE